jgi:hypothetical protein
LEPSIESRARWTSLLVRACHDAAGAEPTGLESVLTRLREAAGAERAFLIESAAPPASHHVVAASVARSDRTTAVSARVAARALGAEAPSLFADLSRDAMRADGRSIRALALRSALAAPVPARGGRRAALLLDSRETLPWDHEAGGEMVRAFGGLVALIRGAGTCPSVPGGERPRLHLDAAVATAARVTLPVLIVGETGTGKERVARALHERGPRSRKPFVAINCAAIPETLLERELFGSVRGAFTGADRDHRGLLREADGGTVFLDEIGDMPPSLQPKLLRVLQEGTVRAVGAADERAIDVRVVAATHRDLAQLVAEGRFRADLRWRLEVLVLRVPALRDRLAELPSLACEIVEKLAFRCGLPRALPDAGALARLAAHDWPGNVRELESVLARALVGARRAEIGSDDLEFSATAHVAPAHADAAPRTLERLMIEGALRAARGNVTAAALRIGWSRQALYRRMSALGLAGDRQEDSDPGGTSSSESSTFQ